MTAAEKLKIKALGKMVLTNEEYHAHEAVGSTSLKNILRSPAHYLYELENPSEPTPAMALGTAIHEAVLEPNLFKANTVVMPKFEGTGSRAAKDAWLLENHGKRIVKQDDYDNIAGVIRALSEHKTARALLTGGAAEESYFWTDPDTGLPCKCRPDFLRQGHIIVDVKSTVDASERFFSKRVADLSYHLSAAHYLAGVSIVENQKFDEFVLLAVESSAPHGIGCYLLDQTSLDAGEFLRRKALNALAECKKSGKYPCYPDEIKPLGIPNWAMPLED